WSWWQDGSVHRAAWPSVGTDLPFPDHDAGVLDATAAALSGVRGAKSVAKVKMRTEVTSATVTGPQPRLDLAERGLQDLKAAGRITGEVVFAADEGAEDLHVDAALAAPPT